MKFSSRVAFVALISIACFGAFMTGNRTQDSQAAWLENFTVRTTASKVIWHITVCEAWRIRRMSVKLTPEDGWPEYTRISRGGFQDGGCERWRLNTDNIWLEGIWYTQLTVVLGTGEILRTDWKEFYLI